MPTNPFLNYSAVSGSIPNFRALQVKLRELGCSENGGKKFLPKKLLLNFTAVSEFIEPISELYGLN